MGIKAEIPLEATVRRCMGRFRGVQNSCPNIDRCARHLTISHREEPWDKTEPPFASACTTEQFDSFLEIKQ
jgi:hypothetical protein